METRDALLRAAKAVFAAKGFDGATVKDLSEAAGVNVSLVSYHFGGKEGLYRACLESFGSGRLDAAQRVLKTPVSSEDFRVRLTLFCEEFLEAHALDPDIGRILHRECWSEHAVTQSIFREIFLKMFETLVEFIRSSQQSGLVAADANPMLSAGFFFGGLVHTIRTEEIRKTLYNLTIQDPAFRHAVATEAVRNFTRGIFASPTGA